jgi:hypothetical protein
VLNQKNQFGFRRVVAPTKQSGEEMDEAIRENTAIEVAITRANCINKVEKREDGLLVVRDRGARIPERTISAKTG